MLFWIYLRGRLVWPLFCGHYSKRCVRALLRWWLHNMCVYSWFCVWLQVKTSVRVDSSASGRENYHQKPSKFTRKHFSVISAISLNNIYFENFWSKNGVNSPQQKNKNLRRSDCLDNFDLGIRPWVIINTVFISKGQLMQLQTLWTPRIL